MNTRVKKFIGTIAILIFVAAYALVAIALARPILTNASIWTQLAFYAVAGLAWIVPIMPLISWMEKKPRG